MTAFVNPIVPIPNGLKQFLHSGKYSDLVISCGDRTWDAHKVVVCSQCEFFDNACSKGFQEEYSGVIKLDHDPVDAVEAMLEWFYSGDYSRPKAEDQHTNQLLAWLQLNIQVYIIAEKYDILELKTLAWAYITTWTDLYSVDSDEDAVKISDIAALVYADTPESEPTLRNYILRLTFRRIKTLLPCNRFQELLRNGSDFSVDMVRLLASRVEPPDSTADSDSDSDWNSDNSEDWPSHTTAGPCDLAAASPAAESVSI